MKRSKSLADASPPWTEGTKGSIDPFADRPLPSKPGPKTRKAVFVRVEPKTRKALKRIALDRDITLQELMTEAIAGVFEKYGGPGK